SSRRRHTTSKRDWSSDVCSSDLPPSLHRCARELDQERPGIHRDHAPGHPIRPATLRRMGRGDPGPRSPPGQPGGDLHGVRARIRNGRRSRYQWPGSGQCRGGGVTMSIPTTVAKAGVSRGWSELRHTLTNFQDLWGYVFPAIILLVVMLLQRGSTVGPTGFSLGATTLPGAIGMGIAFSGFTSVAAQLMLEREDGTLLRNKAIPHGMTGYMIGKIVLTIGASVVSMLVLL